ncbi:hypothetical protein BDZ91DRAFT_541490 [Kalaharituber pfeilii]|nr:hypothetical protein BDZ91DRAFT_541490 [Kalaharituber pfeilii]
MCGPSASIIQVCKRWHVLCYDGQLWTTFDASEFYKDIPVEKLAGIIIKAGPFIRHLNLRGCVQIQNYWRVELVSNACQNLLSANLEGCKLERNIVHNFVGTNTSLLQINLSGLISVSNMTCRLLGQKCPRLTSLDISWCSGVDSRGIRKIIENCPELRELKASECGRFDEASPMQAIFKSNSLERLYLSGCESLTDESIRIMVEGRNADIDPLTGRTTAPPRKLKHLDLSRCSRLTSATLKHLAYNVPDLEGLQLSGCEGMTDEGFEALLPTVPKLTHLDLEECTQVSNTTVLALAKAPCAVTLKHLQLSYCEQVGDVGLAPLIRACPNLTNLEIDNTRVGDFTLEEIAIRTRNRKVSSDRLGAFVGLRVVIYDCPSISWHGVREVLVRNAVKVPSRAAHGQVVQIKCYYGWQMTVDEHLKRVLRGDLCSANRLESKWAEHMVAVEEGHGRRRRRRRRGDALWAPEDGDDGDEEGAGAASSWRNGRRRRGASCVVM